MSKVEDILSPTGDGTANTTVAAYLLDTTARNSALPAYMYGEIIRVTPFGGNAWWYISTSDSAAVDRTVAATDAGATGATVGSRVANGVTVERLCPYVRQGETLYLVWQGDATGVLQVEKGSGRPFTVTADT
jgi:hypothetical protein